MKELLQEILEVGNSSLSNDQKHQKLSYLWTEVFQRAKEEDYDTIYNFYLMNEDTSFAIDQPPILKGVSEEAVEEVLKHYQGCGYLMEEEATILLDFDLDQARNSFSKLGVLLETSSLNGYCELGQSLTIRPFEEAGFSVTKNTARDCFDYPSLHCFGTVTLPIFDGIKVEEKTYLLDSTYRQFFSTIHCNPGMYDAPLDVFLANTPAPGYFVKDTSFAKELLSNGYVELTKENARKYGEPFFLSSFTKGEVPYSRDDYWQNIMIKTSDYALEHLEGLTASFPSPTKKIR